MNSGKKFEQDFVNSCPSNVFRLRLRDMGGAKFKDVRYFCDFLFYYRDKLVLLELKSTQLNSFPLRNIADHQRVGLLQAKQFNGVVGGFIINFTKFNRTFFIDSWTIDYYIKNQERKSLTIQTCENIGIEINSRQIRTRFEYDLALLFRQLTDKGE